MRLALSDVEPQFQKLVEAKWLFDVNKTDIQLLVFFLIFLLHFPQ